jgi:uncharacterized phosphosugar-binding protein
MGRLSKMPWDGIAVTGSSTLAKLQDRSMKSLTHLYRDKIAAMLDAIVADTHGSLADAISIVTEALIKDHMIYVVGTGHSHMLAEEVFYRAGGIAAAQAILEPELMLHLGASQSTVAERKEGLAERTLSRYPITSGDVVFVVSNSGRNAFPIECALGAKSRGAKVIALTSLLTTNAVTSRHSSGKLLKDIADIVLDNQAPVGDASLTVAGTSVSMAPVSSITGCFILNTILAEAVSRAAHRGVNVDVYQSANAPGKDHSAEQMAERWKARVIGL